MGYAYRPPVRANLIAPGPMQPPATDKWVN
jgi:hypothetical protein